MIRKKRLIGLIGMAALIVGWTGADHGQAADLSRKGATLPPLRLSAPASAKDSDYLGVATGRPFQVADIQAKLILLEIIGVYCPQCHVQRPHINSLYHRLQKDRHLAGKIKMVGLAVGATPKEAAYLVQETQIPYPLLADESFAIHQQLGEPQTPFTIVVGRDGQILWTHLGIIADMNGLYATLKTLAGP